MGCPAPWSAREDRRLREMVAEGLPAREIGKALGRSTSSVERRKVELGVSKKRGRE